MSGSSEKIREPRFYITKRPTIEWWKAWIIRILAVLAALVVSGIITYFVTGLNPLKVYETMIEGSFATSRRLWSLLQEMAILLCISLAVTPAFRMRFWNIGAEGQVLIGGLATTACMVLLGDKIPNWLLLIIMVAASAIAAAIWGLIPAVFKANWNTNETLFTLMMNYIAIQLVSYFCYIWSTPKGSGQIGTINRATRAGWLPTVYNNYLVNILIVVLITAVMFVYLKYTKHGYEIAVVGESENTAKYIGVNVKKVIIRTMILSGAICGIAGLLLVGGTDHTITRETANGRGFTAIMVSWLAKFNPLYMILTSFLVVFLQKGAGEISTNFGLNASFSDIITGIIIFFIIGCEFFINYRINMRKKEVVA